MPIQNAESLSKQARNFDVFISYRVHGGGTIATLLREAFKSRGISAYSDLDLVGGRFAEQLEMAFSECNNYVVVLSPGIFSGPRRPVADDWVVREMRMALARNRELSAFKILPLRTHGFDRDMELESIREPEVRQVFLDILAFQAPMLANRGLGDTLDWLHRELTSKERLFVHSFLVANGRQCQEMAPVPVKNPVWDSDAAFDPELYSLFEILAEEDSPLQDRETLRTLMRERINELLTPGARREQCVEYLLQCLTRSGVHDLLMGLGFKSGSEASQLPGGAGLESMPRASRLPLDLGRRLVTDWLHHIKTDTSGGDFFDASAVWANETASRYEQLLDALGTVNFETLRGLEHQYDLGADARQKASIIDAFLNYNTVDTLLGHINFNDLSRVAKKLVGTSFSSKAAAREAVVTWLIQGPRVG